MSEASLGARGAQAHLFAHDNVATSARGQGAASQGNRQRAAGVALGPT